MSKPGKSQSLPNPANHQVIILTGEFAGQEGSCLGPTHDGLWAVTPDSSNDILALRFDADFGILVNQGQRPSVN